MNLRNLHQLRTLGSLGLALCSLSSWAEQPGAKSEYGIASLLKFAPKQMVDNVRKGSADPVIAIPAQPSAPAPLPAAPASGSAPAPVAAVAPSTELAKVPSSMPSFAASIQEAENAITAQKTVAEAPASAPAAPTLAKDTEKDLQRLEYRMARQQTVSALRSQLKDSETSRPVSRLLASVRTSKEAEAPVNGRAPASVPGGSSDLQSVLAYHLAPRGSSKGLQLKVNEPAVPRAKEADSTAVPRIRVFTELSNSGGSRTSFRRVTGDSSGNSQTQANDSSESTHRAAPPALLLQVK